MTRASAERQSRTGITPGHDKRGAERRAICMPARLAWKDQQGVDRFASVVTRDMSSLGVFVECELPLSLPLYRLVLFQLEPTVRFAAEVPELLRHGRILSAVYRISPARGSGPHGIALRLMVEPHLAVAQKFSFPSSASTSRGQAS